MIARLAVVHFMAGTLAASSSLVSQGWAVVPEPRQVNLRSSVVAFGPEWRLDVSAGIPDRDAAVTSLTEDLATRFHIILRGRSSSAPVLRLVLSPGSVVIGPALDHDRAILAEQSYRLDLAEQQISVTANGPAGLFYGVQTLIQLLGSHSDGRSLPAGQIVDWPDLRLRQIYWDDAHHLESIPALKYAIRQAAFYKINGFVIKLEGHFQYASAPALVEPQALSPAEFQELTDYGRRYHVQVIPYLDAPGHIAFILKHPQYAPLRAFPDSNYELCVANPDSYKLLFGMFDDLIAANQGVHYFYLSTDEAYYVGMADTPRCPEKAAASKAGSNGKLLAEFITKAADHLRAKGREVIFWGEHPLKPEDLPSLPRYIINGEVDSSVDRKYRDLGIRQTIYTAIEGEEKLFPDYFLLPPGKRLHPAPQRPGRVLEAFGKIAADTSRRTSELLGALVAGWADMGLHPETFWLGYTTSIAASWNPAAEPRELMSSFYVQFFGPATTQMDAVYQLLSGQAQFWADSWETQKSTARKGIFGNSTGVFETRRPANDQTLSLPPLGGIPQASVDWEHDNARRLELAAELTSDSDTLTGLLLENLRRASYNRYSLEVFVTVNAICRHNLDLLGQLARANRHIHNASDAKSAQAAVEEFDRALDLAENIRLERNKVLRNTVAVWYQSWRPRVSEANGRKVLHELDDVKDHLPDRTVDMSYLVYRELLLPMNEWSGRLLELRNSRAVSAGLERREFQSKWQEFD